MQKSEAEEIFKKTYNANYIKHLSPEEVQEIFNSSNEVQQRLILNLKHQLEIKFDIIEGPQDLMVFRLLLNSEWRTYYLFGESHYSLLRGPDCHPEFYQSKIRFTEFIEKLAQYSSSFFDIYVELPIEEMIKPLEPKQLYYTIEDKMIRRLLRDFDNSKPSDIQVRNMFDSIMLENNENIEELEKDVTLNNLYKKFTKCANINTRNQSENKLDCQLMRFHPSDIRQDEFLFYPKKRNYSMSILFTLVSDPEFSTERMRTSDICKLQRIFGIREFINKMCNHRTFNIDGNSVLNFILEYLPKNKKEIEKTGVFEPLIKRFFISQINSQINKIFGNTSNCYFELRSMSELIYGNMIDKKLYDKYFIFFTNTIISYTMDIYIISRMFMPFLPKQRSTGETETKAEEIPTQQQPIYSYNNIVYSGSLHNRTFVLFLVFLRDLINNQDPEILNTGLTLVKFINGNDNKPNNCVYVPIFSEEFLL